MPGQPPGTGLRGLAIRATADSVYVPREHMMTFLKSVDDLVINAVNGPVPLTSLALDRS